MLADLLAAIGGHIGEVLSPTMVKAGIALVAMMGLIRYVAGPSKLHQLFTDKDGDIAPIKIGAMLASMTFTLKMLGLVPDSPDDALLWLIFMGTVGGMEIAHNLIAARFGGDAGRAPTPTQ